jgi:biopolymer transport protein ExbD
MSQSGINVTPLIDVLLVLLIIFMIIAPSKPTDFKTRIPQQAKEGGETHIHTLVVALNSNSTLRLNQEQGLGTLDDPQKLIERLQKTFQERTKNHVYAK